MSVSMSAHRPAVSPRFLLANGASLVFSIDVGREQLHPSLRGHPNVVSMEQTDIRSLEGKRLPARPDVS
jgi:Predicted rRNA methylase